MRNRKARAASEVTQMHPLLIAKMDASNSDNFQILGQFWLFPVIAKMDARKSYDFDLLGQFYLVPVIAKMDVSKVNIYGVSDGYH